MVGKGGGVPSRKNDIRLGDVVVSKPTNGIGGVYQYDFGKTIHGREFQQTGHLNQPPPAVLAAIKNLESFYNSDGHKIKENIETILEKKPSLSQPHSQSLVFNARNSSSYTLIFYRITSDLSC